MPLLIHDARVLTMPMGREPARGAAMRELGVVDRGWVLIGDDGLVDRVGTGTPPVASIRIDARGRVLMPALIDAHTHACWTGDRWSEWARKRAGEPYLSILNSGGGIMSSVRSVRGSTREDLARTTALRLQRMARVGTGTCEVKSGYGLSTEAELRMLGAIDDAAAACVAQIGTVATCLAGHAIDPGCPDFVARTLRETLPAIAAARPGTTMDLYIEQGAWMGDDAVRFVATSLALGCPVRAHVDQFTRSGLLADLIGMGVRSVDHLEASSASDLATVAHSGAFAVALPATGFALDMRFMDARRLLDEGGTLVIASNANPGSAPGLGLPFAMQLAARFMGLTSAEILRASITNAAHLLGVSGTVGSIEPGQRADLMLLHDTNEDALVHGLPSGAPGLVLHAGRAVNADEPGFEATP
ncbi:MAG: amidohydrolase family protein [Planctomycetes bacterium]|nr:amidohydrolase family protein [Planctomycetota bacterium]